MLALTELARRPGIPLIKRLGSLRGSRHLPISQYFRKQPLIPLA